MKKAGKYLGIIGGVFLFYESISMVSFIIEDLVFAIFGILGILASVAAITGNSFVEGKRLKPALLAGAACTSAVLFGVIIIPGAVSGTLQRGNELTFAILGIMLLTCVLLVLSAVFTLRKQTKKTAS